MIFAEKETTLLELNPSQIKEPVWGNPRTTIADADYQELLSSIRAKGIHTPIMVRPVTGGYEIVAGWTRRRAAIECAFETIPCLVRDMSDNEAYELAVSENSDRTQLSIFDEAKSFRRIVENHNGDLNAAAEEMGWNKAKFDRALQLLRASEKVQNLIGHKQDNGFILSVGHAARLSVLPESLQDKIVDAVIRDKMTVAILKDKIDKAAKRPLATAVFCTQDCQNCQFNTEIQTSLFSEEQAANCTNPPCFTKKTEEHFEAKMKELESEYGKVVLLSTISDPVTVDAQQVGKEQFNNGCLGCDKHCAVLADKGMKQGQIMEHQCLDRHCATEHGKAEQQRKVDAAKAQNEPQQPSANATQGAPTKPTASAPKAKAQVSATMPKRLILESQTALRTTAKNALTQHPSYFLAVAYAALNVKCESGLKMEDQVIKAMSLSPEELEKAMSKAIDKITHDVQREDFNVERMLIRAANTHIEGFQEQATHDWTPTQERLKDMTNAIRQQVLEQSGFAQAYQDAHSEKEYQSLLKLKTDDQVKAILAFTFDWSEYAPDYYLKATKEQRYNF